MVHTLVAVDTSFQHNSLGNQVVSTALELHPHKQTFTMHNSKHFRIQMISSEIHILIINYLRIRSSQWYPTFSLQIEIHASQKTLETQASFLKN